jgi:hypothetical protein
MRIWIALARHWEREALPSFVVASVVPAFLTQRTSAPVGVRMVRRMYIVDAANDQAAIDLVAGWDSEPADTDYLAIPFNPKKASS